MNTIYQTDRRGILICELQADPDPMNPALFLLPAWCVSVPPPVAGPDQVARWTGEQWELVPDLRGRPYWLQDGTRHVVTQAGQALPEGALDAPPPEIQRELLGRVVEAHQDTVARAWRYSSMLSAGTYAAVSTVAKYKAEGTALVAWRDRVWAHVDQVEDQVRAGQREIPTPEALLAELPAPPQRPAG